MITALYAGVLALFGVFLTISVIRTRFAEKIPFGDGKSDLLMRKRTAHSNFMETTPIFLILMLSIEIQGALSLYVIHALGVLFVLARAVHVKGIMNKKSGNFRVIGMAGSLSAIIIAALLCLWIYGGTLSF